MECPRTEKGDARHGRLHVLEDDVFEDAPVDLERGGLVQSSVSLGFALAVCVLDIPVPFEGRWIRICFFDGAFGLVVRGHCLEVCELQDASITKGMLTCL